MASPEQAASWSAIWEGEDPFQRPKRRLALLPWRCGRRKKKKHTKAWQKASAVPLEGRQQPSHLQQVQQPAAQLVTPKPKPSNVPSRERVPSQESGAAAARRAASACYAREMLASELSDFASSLAVAAAEAAEMRRRGSVERQLKLGHRVSRWYDDVAPSLLEDDELLSSHSAAPTSAAVPPASPRTLRRWMSEEELLQTAHAARGILDAERAAGRTGLCEGSLSLSEAGEPTASGTVGAASSAAPASGRASGRLSGASSISSISGPRPRAALADPLARLRAYVPTCLRAYVPTCLRAYTCLYVPIRAYVPTCLRAYVPTCLRAYAHAYLLTHLAGASSISGVSISGRSMSGRLSGYLGRDPPSGRLSMGDETIPEAEPEASSEAEADSSPNSSTLNSTNLQAATSFAASLAAQDSEWAAADIDGRAEGRAAEEAVAAVAAVAAVDPRDQTIRLNTADAAQLQRAMRAGAVHGGLDDVVKASAPALADALAILSDAQGGGGGACGGGACAPASTSTGALRAAAAVMAEPAQAATHEPSEFRHDEPESPGGGGGVGLPPPPQPLPTPALRWFNPGVVPIADHPVDEQSARSRSPKRGPRAPISRGGPISRDELRSVTLSSVPLAGLDPK